MGFEDLRPGLAMVAAKEEASACFAFFATLM